MCEYWNLHATKDEGGVSSYAFKPVRFCASAAHIYGKRRVMAEAFTEWGIRWDEDFCNLQDVANRHFARGVTHLALQSSTHVPVPDATPPGACMYGGNGTPHTAGKHNRGQERSQFDQDHLAGRSTDKLV